MPASSRLCTPSLHSSSSASGAEPPAALVDQGQRIAHHRLAQRVAAGMLAASPGGEHAARHQGVDLRRHRMVRVQPLDAAVRRRRKSGESPTLIQRTSSPRHRDATKVAPMLVERRGRPRPSRRPPRLAACKAVGRGCRPARSRCDEGVDGDLRGDGAAGMAAHAVGQHGEQRCRRRAASAPSCLPDTGGRPDVARPRPATRSRHV